MPWYLASLPWLVYLLAAWVLGGLFVTRALLKLRGGLEVAALALPVGLVSHMLLANALGRVMFLPFALWWVALLALVGASAWLVRRGEPLAWEVSRAQRLWLLAAVVALGLGVLALCAREAFGDDAGHASMAHLLAAGEFPLRFQCNPALRAAYAYGGNLLAAQVMVVTGVHVFEALSVVKALSVASVAGLAFLAGWRVTRRVGTGLLAVFMLFTVGPMVWLYLPFQGAGLASWAAASPHLSGLVDAARQLTLDPWKYTVVTPGFITPSYAHAHRALAWGFAPFTILLFLALLEAPLSRARRTLALGTMLAATALLQPGALLLLGSGFAGYAAWSWIARRRGAPNSLDVSVAGVLALAGVLAALQGGPVTDSLLDRLDGVVNPTTSFHFDPWHLPSCRARAIDVTCMLLSVANLGLVPFLVPWLALSLWRRGPRVRLVLVLGAVVAYAFPFFFRYEYIDWNIQRCLTYASWTMAVLLAPLLYGWLQQGGLRRTLGLVMLALAGWSGLMLIGVVIQGTWLKDSVTPAYWNVGALDAQVARQAPWLPHEALVFDAQGCTNGTSCRPAIVFGRYTAVSRDRLEYRQPTPAFAQIVADPRAEWLRAAGYTHVYIDAAWWRKLLPEARARLQGAAFELVGQAADAQDFRLLLRVCTGGESCALALPALPGVP